MLKLNELNVSKLNELQLNASKLNFKNLYNILKLALHHIDNFIHSIHNFICNSFVKSKSIFNSINVLLLGLMSEMAFASGTTSAYDSAPTFADIAHRLISGTDFVTRIALAASLIMGVGFIVFAISSYRMHRMNPKFVPLDRPVLYLVIGICLCFLPYLGKCIGVETHSTLDLKKKRAIAYSPRDIDAPLR